MGCACTKYEWMPPEWRHAPGKCKQTRYKEPGKGNGGKHLDIDWLAFLDRMERRRTEILEMVPECPDAKVTPRNLRREWAALTKARNQAFAHLFYIEHRASLHLSLSRTHNMLTELSVNPSWRVLQQFAIDSDGRPIDDEASADLMSVAAALRNAKGVLADYLGKHDAGFGMGMEHSDVVLLEYCEAPNKNMNSTQQMENEQTNSSATSPDAEIHMEDPSMTLECNRPNHMEPLPTHDHADACTATSPGETFSPASSLTARQHGQWQSFLSDCGDNDSFATAPSIASSSALDYYNTQALASAVVGGRYFPGAFNRRAMIARQLTQPQQQLQHAPPLTEQTDECMDDTVKTNEEADNLD